MSWVSDIFGGNQEQARADALDKQLAASEADYAPGGRIYQKIAAEQGMDAADRAYALVRKHAADGTAADAHIDTQIDKAFQDQLASEIGDVTGAVKTAATVPFKLVFKSIPWQAWLLGAGALFLYMGGGKALKDVLKR